MQGDYQIPNLEVPKRSLIGKYGMLRKTYLKEHKNGIYAGMMMSGKLNSHLEEIDQIATNQVRMMVSQMAQQQGITEELKATDQMKWVGMMNQIKQAAEEIVLKEIIDN
ncbi:TnpV protein [Paludicola sp. MB14-C6]|nr:TnpV protein [Paludicola sp. MB14-C6]WMJ24476.1 TnpV protein [Paludicola sp. MB14-C6]